MSANNYQSAHRHIPKERRSFLHGEAGLKSRTVPVCWVRNVQHEAAQEVDATK